jgi:hypothetical protein
MTVRSYRFSFGGSITVDDTTLKAAMLAFEAEPVPGVPDFTEEEKFEITQGLLNFMEGLPPERRMQAFLVNGPLLDLDEKLEKDLRASLPGVVVDLDGVTVAIEASSH